MRHRPLFRRTPNRKPGTVFRFLPGGPSGATQYTNLVLQSEAFSNASWTKVGVTVAAPTVTADSTDVTDPNGANTADKIAFPAVANLNELSAVYQGITLTAEPYTTSIYLRTLTGTATVYLYGSPLAGGAPVFFKACAVTTTWTRFEDAGTGTAVAYAFLLGVDLRATEGAGQSAQIAQTIYAWGAQIERGATATRYIPTTTATVTSPNPQGSYGETITVTRASAATSVDRDGLVATVPANAGRLEPAGLLVEPARTNLVLRSDAFANAAWGHAETAGAAPVVTDNTSDVVDPAGNNTASKIVLADTTAIVSGTDYNFRFQSFTGTVAAYSASVWLRRSTGTGTIYIYMAPAAGSGSGFKTTVALTTSWQRVTLINKTLTAATWYFMIGVDARDSVSAGQAAQTIYAWGAQAELGSHASSYIATVASTVTRAADVVTMDATNWPASGEIAFTADVPYTAPPAQVFLFDSALAGASKGGARITIETNNTMIAQTYNGVSFTTITSAAQTWVAGQPYRIRLVYSAAKVELFRDSVSIANTTSSINLPVVHNSATVLGGIVGSSQQFGGHIHSLAVRSL